MTEPGQQGWDEARARIIGLGETSARKSYYAELQKRLEELRASEADLRTVFNTVHDAIFIHDAEGRVEAVNDSMLRLYRVSPEQAREFRVADYSAPELRPRIAALLQEAQSGSGDLVFEWTARCPVDGSQFDVEVAIRPAVWKNRNMIVAVVRDISERKRAEKERRQLEDQLARASRMESVGRLAGGVAHDFNNTLTPILNYAVMLRDDLPPDDPRRADLEEIVRAAQRARDLTRQLLAFARKQTLTLKPVDLNEVVHGICRMLEHTLRENITLQLALTPRLSAVEGDTGQIEQALLNLVLNAQDAMPDGGVLRIETAMAHATGCEPALPAGEYVRLSVQDSGVGMTEEVRARVFEPFFTTKELGRGTGLGLSTVYGIVKQHGGHIELESEPGRGSTFRVYLPAKGEPVSDRVEDAAETPLPKGSGCILLVEDQEEVRRATQRILERQGYTVLAAGSGEEALTVAAAYPEEIQLLISDVVMAGLSCRELHQQLVARRPALRVIYISGYPADEISRQGVLAEGVILVQKPFTPKELAEHVCRALAKR